MVVEASAAGATGLGWTYAPAAVGGLVEQLLEPALGERDPLDVPGAWAAMVAAVRNAGPWGLAMYAVAAVDIALWDLKARLLGVVARADCSAAGARPWRSTARAGSAPTPTRELSEQLGGWAAQGIPRVKMKVGRDPGDDPRRVAVAREAVGDASS